VNVALAFSIAVSGKGGTGKTMIAGLIIRLLSERTNKTILAIDADPNANLNEVLGVPVSKAVGDIREELLKIKDQLSPGISKEEYLNYTIQQALTEAKHFDLLVMGRPEGPGCYCYVNSVLRRLVDRLSDKYDIVVMDAEAGLEHFSRRTTKDVDVLLITTDPTSRGIMTAKRVKKLIQELHTKVRYMYVIANRTPQSLAPLLKKEIEEAGLELIGTVPEDPKVLEYDLQGKPLVELPESSEAVRAVAQILQKIPFPFQI
jgi:CO dehydrogenase maturation factor